jgi:hypothetical protein
MTATAISAEEIRTMPDPDPTFSARLDGAAIGNLRDLIVSAFDAAELRELVRIKMDVDLYGTVIGQRAPLNTVVFDLLDKTIKDGRTPLLLNAILEAKKGRADLHDAIARHCPQALKPPPPPGDQAQQVARGLDILRSQISRPAVRDVIIPSREKLDQLMEDIDLLYGYKVLHDCLHTIQLRQYPALVSKVRQFRTDPLTSAELEEEIFALQDIAGDARKCAEGLPDRALVRDQEFDWIEKLKSAAAELSRSVSNLDAHGAGRAVNSLRRVIREEPFRVNKLLTLTAGKLPLDELSLTIERVIATVPVGEVSAPELHDALRSLQSLLPQLRGRVAEHRQWQEIDNDLWEAEDCVERHTPEAVAQFTESWPAIKARIASLARADAEADWAKAIERHAALIDQNLTDRVESALNDFRYVRKAGLFHFYQVNKALRAQCAAILAIRAPLRSLLNAITVERGAHHVD